MFKGLGNLGNLASLFRDVQQLGGKLDSMRERLQNQRVSGKAGGGMVTVDVNGMGEVVQVTIDQGLVDRGEREMIEDLLRAAVNQAMGKARELSASELSSTVSGGMDLPFLQEALSGMFRSPSTDDEQPSK